MKPKILILDTSVLCVYLSIPGKDTCDGEIQLTFEQVNQEIESRKTEGWKFVLPVASVVETGNHIAQSPGDRFPLAKTFIKLVVAALQGASPWIVFTDNLDIWKAENCKWLQDWADDAAAGLSLADRTIAHIADDYSRQGYEVEIFTCDDQLKAHQPTPPKMVPRRRQ